MPVHDWTKADAGVFHDFHNTWLAHLKNTLNGGLLPPGYFAMLDQRADVYIPDIVALGESGREPTAAPAGVLTEPVAERMTVAKGGRRPRVRERILVRTARRVVAVIELVSPSNKDGPKHTREFVAKLADLIESGVHLAVIDLIPPGSADPGGLHPLIWELAGLERPGGPAAGRPAADLRRLCGWVAAGGVPELRGGRLSVTGRAVISDGFVLRQSATGIDVCLVL